MINIECRRNDRTDEIELEGFRSTKTCNLQLTRFDMDVDGLTIMYNTVCCLNGVSN